MYIIFIYNYIYYIYIAYAKTFFAEDENNVPMYGLMISGIIAGAVAAGLCIKYIYIFNLISYLQ